MGNQRSFLAELKQRHVVRAAIIYAAAVWALAQGISQLSPAFNLATGVTFWFVIACVIGFPFWIAFAWFFKFTSSGISREGEAPKDAVAVHRTGRILDYWIIGTLAVAVVLLLTNQLVLQRGKTLREFAATAAPAAVTKIPAKSVAVLPFENLSNDKNNEYFVEGMQDLILTKLADIGSLKVIARTSTQSYGSHPENLTKVGEQLGVATVLEGSVQKAGNQVLINVQLIDARSDAHIWADSYTRTLTNIFGVEGEVAERVANALNAKLSPAETARVASVPTHDPVAYDLYLKAQRISDTVAAGGWSGLPTVIAAYQKVVQQDPTFALAYTQLAFSQLLLNWTGIDRSPAVMQEAEANVRKALALQPDLPLAHVVLGYVYRWRYDDYSKALAEYDLAKRGLPNSANVAAAIGFIRATQGDFPAAIAELQRATTLDPRNPHWPCQLAVLYSATGNYTLARQALVQAFAINPSFAEAYAFLSQVDLLESGDAAGALALLNRAPAAIQSSRLLVTARINALLLNRDFVAARHFAEQLQPGHGMSALQVDQTKGNVLWLAGARKDAVPFYAKTLDLLKTELPTTTRSFQTYADLALAAARLGRAGEAEGYGRRMIALAAQKRRIIPYDRGVTPWITLASAYASLGDSDDAVSALGHALARTSGFWVSVPMIKVDPTWDPIRHDPAFQALLKKYAKDKPAVTYDNPPTASAASSAGSTPVTSGAAH